MSGAFLQLSGLRVVEGHVSIPYYGLWTADVMVVSPQPYTVDQAVTLTLGNLTLNGSVYRSGPFAGQQRVRIVAGAGGWRKPAPEQQYVAGGGVRLSMILDDIAKTVGETVNLASDSVIGTTYVRTRDNAEKVLRALAGPLWWVDPAGVTQVAPSRSLPAVGSPFTVVNWDGGRGEFEIATEDYKSWLPGATFSGPTVPTPQTVSLTTIDTNNDGKLRFRVLTVGPPNDRLIEDFRALVRDEMSDAVFLGTYEYSVQSTDGTTADLAPTNGSIGLPSLRSIVMRSGIPGTQLKPARGTLATVTFLNGDPTRPVVGALYDDTVADAIAFQHGSIAAARGGVNVLPPGLSAPYPPGTVVLPTGDPVVLAFTALDSSGNVATVGTHPGMTPPPTLWDGLLATEKAYYPATAVGFLAAMAASASITPTPGIGVGVLTGFVSGGSSTVTIG